MSVFTVAQALNWAKEQLSDGESPLIDARVLLCQVMECTPTWLATYPEKALTPSQVEIFKSFINRRKQGEPVSYITGNQDFWSLTLKVSPHTLIPRPETELLVEQVLSLIRKDSHCNILDLGTGTGAIALALASELPHCEVYAVDRVADAVALAKDNAKALGLERVNILQSNWFESIPKQKFDIIVTNPPYVESDSEWLAQGDVRFEPESALISGIDGLDDIRYIIEEAKKWLKPNGWLLIEHGHSQGEQIQILFTKNSYSQAKLRKDYSNLPRISYAQMVVA